MITFQLNQKATYWPAPTTDGFGALSFAAPTTINVRWEDRIERVITAQGNEENSRAVVWVNQELELGGYLYLGETTEADPVNLDGAYPILLTSVIPDLRNLQNERRVTL